MANFGKQKLKWGRKGLLVAASLINKVQPFPAEPTFIAEPKQHLNTKGPICSSHCLEKQKILGEKRIKALHANESRPWGLSLATRKSVAFL